MNKEALPLNESVVCDESNAVRFAYNGGCRCCFQNGKGRFIEGWVEAFLNSEIVEMACQGTHRAQEEVPFMEETTRSFL